MENNKQKPVNPHAWRRFERAQRNLNKFHLHRSGRKRKSRRLAMKWAREMDKWKEELFK
jgi:hypothetical protein